MDSCFQGVTKRCRLSLLTNSALVIRVQMWGEGGSCGGTAISTAVHITWHEAQINFGDLPQYLTYSYFLCNNFLLIQCSKFTFSLLEGDVRDRLERPGEGGTRHHPPHRAPQPYSSTVLALPACLQQNRHEILQVKPFSLPIPVSLITKMGNGFLKGSQRDVVYLSWPIAPLHMSNRF